MLARLLALALAIFPALAFAQSSPLPGFPPGVFQNRAAIDAGGAPPPTTTAFDPAHLGTALTLSNSNLTATNSTFAFNNARSVASHSIGKFYFEVTLTTSAFGGDAVGIANASEVLNGSAAGSSSNSVGWEFPANSTGNVTINGTAIGTAAGNAGEAGDIVGIAVDLTAGLIWFKFQFVVNVGINTNWNNSGTANPATGVGGFPLNGVTPLNAGPYFAFVSLAQSTDQYTANFGATAYAATGTGAPSGFGNW
jgi:hypothetical protein